MEKLEHARRTMKLAADKAAGQVESFAPYLRAAIIYWRLKEEAAQAAGDMAGQVEAISQRIVSEDSFRRVAGRSYHTVTDAICYDDVNSL